MNTTLKDRVRAATEKPVARPTAPPAAVVEGATVDELQASQQTDGGAAADIVMAWLERYRGELSQALPSHVDAGPFLAAMRESLPTLAYCTPASLVQATLTCARFGLLPDGRHAVIKAEGDRAVFVPMYQGYVELMYRSGRVGSVHMGLIYERDEWTHEPSAPAPLDFTHRPALTLPKAERGKPILAYAFCWMTSGARSQVVLLNREDAEQIRDEYSAAYRRAEASGAADSFWHTDFNAMWQKSGLRRLHKVVPMSAELVALEKVDDAGEAGQVQVIHAPSDRAALLAEAEEAHARAEDSQDPPSTERSPGGERLRPSRTRVQPKRTTRRERRTKARRQ
ncbi:recombinase RecT [Streptomycetaceae bacterium NBC_01309]